MGALSNLAKETSLEYGRLGVDTICVEMGPTGGEDEILKSEISTFYDAYQYKIPSGYLGNANDLASLCAWLISDQCRYLNGAQIRMDGGLVLHYVDERVNDWMTRSGMGKIL
jgi:NAD(P)-dependent dehydrogenase (short-subunit alcohol dehydrogenase family)